MFETLTLRLGLLFVCFLMDFSHFFCAFKSCLFLEVVFLLFNCYLVYDVEVSQVSLSPFSIENRL